MSQAKKHPSEDYTGRFPLDKLLRDYGFSIYSRGKDAEPLWILCGGKIYTQNDAFLSLPSTVRKAFLKKEF